MTGGTEPVESVHDDVVDVLEEEDIDISDRTPRRITSDDVADADYIVTMGCPIDQFRPDGWEGKHRVWSLETTDEGIDGTRDQRDEIKHRVNDFFNKLEDSH